MYAAAALVEKWKRACEEIGPAKTALDSLSASSDPEKVKGWREMAERAAAMRRHKITCMDIYDVHDVKSEPLFAGPAAAQR